MAFQLAKKATLSPDGRGPEPESDPDTDTDTGMCQRL
jgi:hypothetical protein